MQTLTVSIHDRHYRYVIIGAGGVGAIVARYLAPFLEASFASNGSMAWLKLVDGDSYEPKNSERQLFTRLGNKAEVTAEMIGNEVNLTSLVLEHHDEFVTRDNLKELIDEGDVVFCCVDHHGVRRIVSERCQELRDVVLFSGGNEGVEPEKGERGTAGNVQVYWKRDDMELAPSIERFHPEIGTADPDLAPGGAGGCAQVVASVPQLLFANLAVASSMLSAFYAFATGTLQHSEFKFDIVEAAMVPQLPLTSPDTTPHAIRA